MYKGTHSRGPASVGSAPESDCFRKGTGLPHSFLALLFSPLPLLFDAFPELKNIMALDEATTRVVTWTHKFLPIHFSLNPWR